MRLRYTVEDAEFKQTLPIVEQLVDEGKITLLEKSTFEGYFSGDEGLTIVLQKA